MYMSGNDMPLDTTRKKGVVYRCGYFHDARRSGEFDLYELADHKWGVTPLNATGNYAFIIPKSLLKANSNIVSNDTITSGEYYLACIANESLIKYGYNSDCSPLPDNIIGVVKLNITDATSIAQIAGYSDEAALCTGIANQGILDFTATSLADYFIFGVTNANAQELGLDATVSSAMSDEEKGIPASWDNMDGAMMYNIFGKDSDPGDLRGYYQIYTVEQLKAYGLNHPKVNPIEDDALVVWDGYMWRSLTGGSAESVSQAASTLTHNATLVKSSDFNKHTWRQNQLYQAGDDIDIDAYCGPYSFNSNRWSTENSTDALRWSFEYTNGSLILKAPKREAACIFLSTTPEKIVVELSSQDGVIYTDKLPSPIICAVCMDYTTNANMVTKFGGTWSNSYWYFVCSYIDNSRNIMDKTYSKVYGNRSIELACSADAYLVRSIYPADLYKYGFRSAPNSIHRLAVGDYFYYDGYMLCKLYPSEDDMLRAGSNRYNTIKFTGNINDNYYMDFNPYANNNGNKFIPLEVATAVSHGRSNKIGTMKMVTSKGGPVSTAVHIMKSWECTSSTTLTRLYPNSCYCISMCYSKSGPLNFSTEDSFLVACYLSDDATSLSVDSEAASILERVSSFGPYRKLVALLPFRKCSYSVAEAAGCDMASQAQDGLYYALLDVENPLLYMASEDVPKLLAYTAKIDKYSKSPINAAFFNANTDFECWNGWNDDAEFVQATDNSGKTIYTMDVLPNAKQGDYVMWDGHRYVKMNDSGLNSASLTKVISTTGGILLQSNLDSIVNAGSAFSPRSAIPIYKFDNFDPEAIPNVAVMMPQNTNDNNGNATWQGNIRIMEVDGDFVELCSWPDSSFYEAGMRLTRDGTVYMYKDPRASTCNAGYFLLPIPLTAPTLSESDVAISHSNWQLTQTSDRNKSSCIYQNVKQGLLSFKSSNNACYMNLSSFVGGTITIGLKFTNNYTSATTFTISYTDTSNKSASIKVTVPSKSSAYQSLNVNVGGTVPTVYKGADIPISARALTVSSSSYTSRADTAITIDGVWIFSTMSATVTNPGNKPSDTALLYWCDRNRSSSSNYCIYFDTISFGTSSTSIANELSADKSNYIAPSADTMNT